MEEDNASDEEKHDSDPGRESAEESDSSNSSKSSQEPPDEDDKIGWQVFEHLLEKKIKHKWMRNSVAQPKKLTAHLPKHPCDQHWEAKENSFSIPFPFFLFL